MIALSCIWCNLKSLCRAIQKVKAGQKWPAGPTLAAPALESILLSISFWFFICTLFLFVCLYVHAFNLVCVLLCSWSLIRSYFLSVFSCLLSIWFSLFVVYSLSLLFSFWAEEIQESIVFRETHFKMFTSTNFTIDYHLQWGCSTLLRLLILV